VLFIKCQRTVEWARNVACMGEKGDTCRVLMFKVEGKKAFERPVRRWEYNTTVDLKQIWWRACT
jgi:hypothetical protein